MSRLRPSPSFVIATAALVVALGGTSYAVARLPANSVGATQLRANSVTGAKVKNGSLLTKDFARGQLPAGARGDTGPAGAVGALGATGARGPSDAFGATGTDRVIAPGVGTVVPLAEQTLPAGSFVGLANFYVTNPVGDPARDLACGLSGAYGYQWTFNHATAVDFVELHLEPGATEPVALAGFTTLSTPTSLLVGCLQSGPMTGSGVQVKDIDIGAIEVGALHG